MIRRDRVNESVNYCLDYWTVSPDEVELRESDVVLDHDGEVLSCFQKSRSAAQMHNNTEIRIRMDSLGTKVGTISRSENTFTIIYLGALVSVSIGHQADTSQVFFNLSNFTQDPV